MSVSLPVVSSTAPPTAVAPSDRILTIDILRALALFGVLMVNLVTEFRISIFQQFVPSSPPASPVDRFLDTLVSYAFDYCFFPTLCAAGTLAVLSAPDDFALSAADSSARMPARIPASA
jgi:hypothetical protein